MLRKKKHTIMVIFAFMIICVVALLIVSKLVHNNKYSLEASGTLYENLSDFNVSTEDKPLDELTQVYLENISYEIVEIDNDKMTATIAFQIPKISDELSDVLDKIISENSNKKYDELKALAKKELASVLGSKELEYETTNITLPIKEVDATYKFIPNEEWNKLITENLENLYMEYLKTLIGGMTDEMPQ